MLAAIALLAAAPSDTPPTLADIRKLPPGEAGEIVLKGQEHRPIVTARQPCCMLAPWYTYELIEAPAPVAGGCTRVVWHARFQSPYSGDPPTALLQKVIRYEGVALPINGLCPAEGYTYSSLPPPRVFALLKMWKDVLHSRRTEFRCADASPTELCRDRRHIRDDLSAKWVGGIGEEAGSVHLVLNVPLVNGPAQIYTEVTFDIARKLPVRVLRKVPAPF